MNIAALQHEATARWCFALAPGRFCIRMQAAAGDLAAVTLHALDKYAPRRTPEALRAVPMRRIACDGRRDTFAAEVELDLVCLRYYFELTDTAGRTLYFGMDEVLEAPPTDIERMFDCPQTLREAGRFSARTGRPTRSCIRCSRRGLLRGAPCPTGYGIRRPSAPSPNCTATSRA